MGCMLIRCSVTRGAQLHALAVCVSCVVILPFASHTYHCSCSCLRAKTLTVSRSVHFEKNNRIIILFVAMEMDVQCIPILLCYLHVLAKGCWFRSDESHSVILTQFE